MKEFIVNTHKVCNVECDITVDACPVTQMLLERKAKKVDTESCSVFVNSDAQRTCVCTKTRDVRNLKRNIMELCMECNVQGR